VLLKFSTAPYLAQISLNCSDMLLESVISAFAVLMHFIGIFGQPARRLMSDHIFLVVERGEILDVKFSRDFRFSERTVFYN